MKLFRAFVPVIILSILLCGCSFRLASSVDDLISPISPSGDNVNVQKALDSYCNGGYSLKTPSGGKYTTSYIFYDIDADNVEEAIVFYEASANLGTINMAVIDKISDNWSVICNLEGIGTDIYSIDFCDLNGDNSAEFVIMWDAYGNSLSHTLAVYRQSNEENFSLSQIGNAVTVNNYVPVDIDNDNVDELMVFTVDSGDSISANAVVYAYKTEDSQSLANTRLDGHISSYKSIISSKSDDRVYIFADAVKSNGNQMLTEIILWSDRYGTIVSPFYSYSTGVTKQTTRSSMLTCRDINDDGDIEIPLDAENTSSSSYIETVNWKHYNGSVLSHICYSVAVQKDNYQLIISDEYFDKLSFSYDEDSSKLIAADDHENVVFTVSFLLDSRYDDDSPLYSEYTEILSDSGYVYLAVCGNDSDIKITAEDLKSMIKPYEGE